MKSINIKKLYVLHSWVGLVTGILLFVIAFTGAVSVFGRPELKIWANNDIRTPAQLTPIQIETLVDKYAQQVPENYLHMVQVALPGVRSAAELYIRFEDHKEGTVPQQPAVAIQFKIHPHTLELIERKEGELRSLFENYDMDMADFLVGFHADLHMGRPWGLLTTGVLGLTLMLSIITGFVVHRKVLKQMFTFRTKKTKTLLLNDGHKVMGIWGMLFHGVIAFTGAFLGLALVILVPAAAFVSFEGDQDKLLQTFNTMPDPVLTHVHQPTHLAKALTHAQNYQQGAYVTNINVLGYGDENAMLYFNLLEAEQMHPLRMQYQGNSGEFLDAYGQFGKIEGVSGKILDLMGPLHFGNFGGIIVKVFWAILGLSTALLPITGLMLWLERGVNAANPKYSRNTYLRFNRLILGSCGGLVVACALLFPVQLMLNYVWIDAAPNPIIMGSFFGSWALLTLIAMVWKNSAKLTTIMVNLTALLLVTVLPLDALLSGSHPFNMADTQHYISTGVNLTLFGLAPLLLWGHWRWSTVGKLNQSQPDVAPQQQGEQT